jgi:hypothetical protein
MAQENAVVEMIGRDLFEWFVRNFDKKTTLKEVPDEIIDRIASVDIATRNYATDPNSILVIALITFAYKLAEKSQMPYQGGKDILLAKALAKGEKKRRDGLNHRRSKWWDAPLYDLITGEVGERIRSLPTMNSPRDSHA